MVMKQVSKKQASEAPRERIVKAARRLFGLKGFYATTTAELASEASVSMGQIYRHFTSKDDIILAIVEENVHTRVVDMDAIFADLESGAVGIFDAIRKIIDLAIQNDDSGLLFETLAEALRNPSVSERLEKLTECYQSGVRRLAALARPDLPSDELDAYADVMTASLIGLGHKAVLAPSKNSSGMSHKAACLMMHALDLEIK